MIFAGWMMWKHCPKDINGLVGYRTTRSALLCLSYLHWFSHLFAVLTKKTLVLRYLFFFWFSVRC